MPTESQSPAVGPAFLNGPQMEGRGAGPARIAAVMQLQRSHGNHATTHLIRRLAEGASPSADAGEATSDSSQTIQRVLTGMPTLGQWEKHSSRAFHKRSTELQLIDTRVDEWDDVKDDDDKAVQLNALQNILYAIRGWRDAKQLALKTGKRAPKIADLEQVVTNKQAELIAARRDDLAPTVSAYRAAIKSGNLANARAAANLISAGDNAFFGEIVEKALTRTAGNPTRWARHYFTTPLLYYGMGKVNPATLAGRGDFSWMDQAFADDIITNFLMPLKGKVGDRTVIQLLQIRAFHNALRLKATKNVWRAFTAGTPLLDVIYQARARVTAKGGTIKKGVGAVADEIVAGFIEGKGITTAYSATTPGGNKIEMRKSHAVRSEAACHDLVAILEDIFKAWPGDPPTITFGVIDPPVLTKPLGTILRTREGLINSGFAGNVFTEAGGAYTPTGQVFFTAQPRAHTWIIINGTAYDVLFGIVGGQVGGTPEEEFHETAPESAVYVGAASGRRLVRDPAVYDAGRTYNFGSGYILKDAD